MNIRFTTPDGKDVALKWVYNIRASSASQVLGHAVAPRFQTIEDFTGHEVVSTSTKYWTYTVFISVLRMSINYSFEVHPVDRKRFAQQFWFSFDEDN